MQTCDLLIRKLKTQQKETEQINNPFLQQVTFHPAKLGDFQSLPQGNHVSLKGLSQETVLKMGMKNVRGLEWSG